MTLICSRPLKGRARLGTFHNVRTDEETGYFYLHVFGACIGVLWTRGDA